MLDGLGTPQGITAVAGASQSRREEGYWNGNVWIPHQWLMFMACLSNGRSAEALQIAKPCWRYGARHRPN